jgi:hypothetical protein
MTRTIKSHRCFSEEPGKISTLININDENIKEDSNLEQGNYSGQLHFIFFQT